MHLLVFDAQPSSEPSETPRSSLPSPQPSDASTSSPSLSSAPTARYNPSSPPTESPDPSIISSIDPTIAPSVAESAEPSVAESAEPLEPSAVMLSAEPSLATSSKPSAVMLSAEPSFSSNGDLTSSPSSARPFPSGPYDLELTISNVADVNGNILAEPIQFAKKMLSPPTGSTRVRLLVGVDSCANRLDVAGTKTLAEDLKKHVEDILAVNKGVGIESLTCDDDANLINAEIIIEKGDRSTERPRNAAPSHFRRLLRHSLAIQGKDGNFVPSSEASHRSARRMTISNVQLLRPGEHSSVKNWDRQHSRSQKEPSTAGINQLAEQIQEQMMRLREEQMQELQEQRRALHEIRSQLQLQDRPVRTKWALVATAVLASAAATVAVLGCVVRRSGPREDREGETMRALPVRRRFSGTQWRGSSSAAAAAPQNRRFST